MALTAFKDSSFQLSTLIDEIKRGEIGLPDIQRPFVWKPTKVRELFDSMYRGFPVGFFLFWATGAEAGARQIGTGQKEAAPRLMIIDGQQRLTALYSVLTGQPVVREDYSEAEIRIAFRPRDAKFEVSDAAKGKDPEFIPDISVLWGEAGRRQATRDFFARLEASKGTVSQDERDQLEDAIDRLHDLRNYPFKVVELSADLDDEQVADVFVRINSEGVRLEQADFILTLMSVWWDEGRKQLEDFCRRATNPSPREVSAANPFIDPSPDQLLRVAAGLAFNRGRLRSVYQVLRGKDLETGEVRPEARDRQFASLRDGVSAALNLTNWHEFLKAVRRAGYRSRSMITSENNLLFAYLMYLVGLRDHNIPRIELREVIARWFFTTALSGRYTGSFESTVEADLQRVAGASSGEQFIKTIDQMIDTVLTNDFWDITLPSALETSAAYSPTLFAYHASLVLLDARALFSRLSIAELMDPHTHAPRSAVERHHLFPKGYLRTIGIERVAQRNQIANFAFLEWPDNAEISDRPPAEYFPEMFSRLTPAEQKQARFWHALPDDWTSMAYDDFLAERRRMIAGVVRAAFERLRSGALPFDDSDDDLPLRSGRLTVADLLESTETGQVEFKSSAYFSYKPNVPERVISEMVIKTVAGFLNAEGGTLAIGITDDNDVVGIRADLDHKNMDEDRYVNALTTLLERALSPAAAAAVGIEIEDVGGDPVCLVHVPPSGEPTYANTSKGATAFYVRMNNSTRMLEGPDLVSYIRRRWG